MYPYTFLFINMSGDFESIAQRIKQEGYPIFYYKQKGMAKGREDTGLGIFEKDEITDDFWEVINKVPQQNLIILIDDNGMGDMMDYLKNQGYRVIGGSSYADKIEYQRGLGTKLMEKIGLAIPEEHVFDNIDEAISFMSEQPASERFVFKPEGEDFAGSSKTYTGKNRQDLIDYLKWIKEDTKVKHYEVNKFLLQEFINGIEADFSAYFDGDKFMKGSINIDIEEKKTGDGNKGEANGCMGNVVLFVEKSRYFDEYIKKLTPMLRKIKFTGQISINNIFAYGNKEYKDGTPYGLEFTPRFGWDAHLTEVALHLKNGQKLSDFYISLVEQKDFEFPTGLVGCGVRVFTGSISLKKEEVAGRYFSFPKEIEDNLYFYSVAKDKNSYTIQDNPVLVLNTAGKNLKSTIKECYDKLKLLNIPDIYYREQIGMRAEEVLLFLKKYNWI